MSMATDVPGFETDLLAASHPHGRPFWQAASEGLFLMPRCRACGRAHWYPRPFCPFCASGQVEWEHAAGLGSVLAFTALARAKPTSIVAYVRLDEGPAMLTNLVECDVDQVRIGDRVRVAFRAALEGRMVPVFVPMIGTDAAAI